MHVDTCATKWVYRIVVDEEHIVIGVHENLGCEPTSVSHFGVTYGYNRTQCERPIKTELPQEGVRYFRFDRNPKHKGTRL